MLEMSGWKSKDGANRLTYIVHLTLDSIFSEVVIGHSRKGLC